MATNPYFNHISYANTQNLFQDLVTESIKIHGYNFNYLVRDIDDFDTIFGEGIQYSFSNNHIIEAYIYNYENWGGQGDMMSKFGIMLDHQMITYISKARFTEEFDGVLTMPREGDLLYFPITKSFFEINHVNHESQYWPQGANYCWELKSTLYKYEGSDFDTGNTEIDTEIAKFPVSNTSMAEPTDNDDFDTLEDDLIDTSEQNPYGFDV